VAEAGAVRWEAAAQRALQGGARACGRAAGTGRGYLQGTRCATLPRHQVCHAAKAPGVPRGQRAVLGQATRSQKRTRVGHSCSPLRQSAMCVQRTGMRPVQNAGLLQHPSPMLMPPRCWAASHGRDPRPFSYGVIHTHMHSLLHPRTRAACVRAGNQGALSSCWGSITDSMG